MKTEEGAVKGVTDLSKIFKIVLCCLLTVGLLTGIPMTATTEAGEAVALSFHYPEGFLDDADANLSLRLLGFLTAQTAAEASYPEVWLIPGGQPIGILLRTDGILVVGQSAVVNQQGKSCFPAEDAGVKAGDVIVSVNGVHITHDDQLAAMVNQLGSQGQEIVLKILRQEKQVEKKITPVYCQESKSFRIGLYIRDNAGGVGTLTFVDEKTGQYGALGHMISNNETQRKIDILNGKLVGANIEGIKKGQEGYPGEKIGRFVSNASLGSIEKNTSAGIFGVFTDKQLLAGNLYGAPLPTAAPSEIQLGDAQILTAIDGMKVESFTVKVERVMPHGDDGKGMVLRVTDPILLEKTGGIVQGMSGSPILQNGKIIGAVTHVFINDPTKGYGILIHDMLKQTTILEASDDTEIKSAA